MIKKAIAEYTGGNIWIFYGDLDDGTFFLTDDDGRTAILDASPDNFDESLYTEWLEEHTLRELTDESERVAFCDELCDKLLEDGSEHGFFDSDVEAYRTWFAERL